MRVLITGGRDFADRDMLVSTLILFTRKVVLQSSSTEMRGEQIALLASGPQIAESRFLLAQRTGKFTDGRLGRLATEECWTKAPTFWLPFLEGEELLTW